MDHRVAIREAGVAEDWGRYYEDGGPAGWTSGSDQEECEALVTGLEGARADSHTQLGWRAEAEEIPGATPVAAAVEEPVAAEASAVPVSAVTVGARARVDAWGEEFDDTNFGTRGLRLCTIQQSLSLKSPFPLSG